MEHGDEGGVRGHDQSGLRLQQVQGTVAAGPQDWERNHLVSGRTLCYLSLIIVPSGTAQEQSTPEIG